jgi:hypothetical protein
MFKTQDRGDITCHILYLLCEIWSESPYVIASAMKEPIGLPANQQADRKGCSLRVQYCPTMMVRIGAMHDSKNPRKTLLMQSVAKLVVAAVVVAVAPQRI